MRHDDRGSLACIYECPWFSLTRSGAGEDVDRLAVLGQRDDGSLGGFALAVAGPGALALALPVERVHRDDLDPVEDLLDGNLHLGLVGVRVHLEGVAAGLQQAIALLGHDRPDDDVARIGDHFASSSVLSSAAVSAAAGVFVSVMASSGAACRPDGRSSASETASESTASATLTEMPRLAFDTNSSS